MNHGRGGLAEVVAQRPEHQHQPVLAHDAFANRNPCSGVTDKLCVDPDVAFRVIAGVLAPAHHREQFRVMREPSGILQCHEASARNIALFGPLGPLHPNPFDCEMLILVEQLRAQPRGPWMDVEPKSSGELHGAQHSEWILREGRPDVPQDAAMEILDSAEVVQELPCVQINRHCVPGKIPACSGLTWGHVRVDSTLKPLWPRPDLLSRRGRATSTSVPSSLTFNTPKLTPTSWTSPKP